MDQAGIGLPFMGNPLFYSHEPSKDLPVDPVQMKCLLYGAHLNEIDDIALKQYL